MDTFMNVAVGRYVAVGMAWEVNASGFFSGFGMSTKAMLGGVGVADFAQLEKIRAYTITTK